MIVYKFNVEFEDVHADGNTVREKRVGYTFNGDKGYHCHLDEVPEIERLLDVFGHKVFEDDSKRCSTSSFSPPAIMINLIDDYFFKHYKLQKQVL